MRHRLTRRELLGCGAGLAGAALGAGAATPGLSPAWLISRGRLGGPAAAAAQSALGRWVTRASLPFARTEVSVAALGGKMYLIGGYAHGRVDQPFNQEYDPAADRWRDLAPMPRGLNHVGVIGVNGRIYAVGGFIQQNRNAIADAFEYDVAANRWRMIRSLPAKRGAMSVVELAGKLHLVGGRDETSVGAHDVYNPRH